jgi:hypothetical protein
MILNSGNQALYFLCEPSRGIVSMFMGNTEMEKEFRQYSFNIAPGFAPALIEATHGVASRHNHRALKKVQITLSRALQHAFGKAADKGAEVGIPDRGFPCTESLILREVSPRHETPPQEQMNRYIQPQGFPVPSTVLYICYIALQLLH